MKIQTQARLLTAGIILAPLLIFLTNFYYRYFFDTASAPSLPAYEYISFLQEDLSAESWEFVSRFISRIRNLDSVAVFTSDYLVLHSTIPEFEQGVFTDMETIMSLLSDEKRQFSYSFSSHRLEENLFYILSSIIPLRERLDLRPLFIRVTIFFILIILLAVFAIVMSIVIARTITRSVQILENNTRRIAEGELNLNVDVKGSNEIISLTNSLNKMRNTLKEEELRRSRFIMGISHDLRTPLALIKGYAEAIEDDVIEPAARADASRIIIGKADQLEGMINDLIDFVRMDSGEWREQLDEINVTAFLKNFAKTIKADVELLHHELIPDISLQENLLLPMDEKLTQRALENLIHNAVRYTPPGSLIRFSAVQNENNIEITVSDNGPGLDKETLPHIFEMFFRGTSSRREQGLGLGLAVVKWIVDYHGWTIHTSSEKGKGTSFAIIVPLK